MKVLYCEPCDIYAKYKSNMGQHLATKGHLQKTEGMDFEICDKYKCDKCNKLFSSKKSQQYHLVHSCKSAKKEAEKFRNVELEKLKMKNIELKQLEIRNAELEKLKMKNEELEKELCDKKKKPVRTEKQRISKAHRMNVWKYYFGDNGKSKCMCCGRAQIDPFIFEC